MLLQRLRWLTLLCITSVTSVDAADWPLFRGPNRDGQSQDTAAPLEWGRDKNVRWKVRLPSAGNSSPIVTADRVFLTCAEDRRGSRRSLYCFDRADGKQLWVKTVAYEGREPSHETNPYCASTPASDGQRVVAWHGSAGLYCYDLEGRELWNADLGPFRHIWGYASSPVIHGDRVFLNCGPGARSFVVALDKNTGTTLWQTEEPGGKDDGAPNWLGSWSTGVVTSVDGQEQLLVFQSARVVAYDLANGKILWTHGGAGPLAYTDVVVGDVEGVGKVGLALAGYGGKAVGFKLPTRAQLGQAQPLDTTETHRLWQSTAKPPQRIGSGVLRGRHYFFPNETGIECIDATTGKQAWFHREPGNNFWASIVGTPDRLYATSQQGTVLVFAPDATGWRLLATNVMKERTNATPAISGKQLFVRTWEHLYCIEQQ